MSAPPIDSSFSWLDGTIVVTLVCLRAVGWGGMVGAVEAHMGGRGFDPVADLGAVARGR